MVSIIIATYNSGKTLRRALDSVLNQSYQDWECIVVDGASKDNTIGIVKEYVKKDSRFRYISEPDHGIYDAFNKGWKMAKGANSTSKCKITKCFCKSTPLVLRNSIFFLVSH